MTECAHRWTVEGHWSRDGAHYSQRCAGCHRYEPLTSAQFFATLNERAEGTGSE